MEASVVAEVGMAKGVVVRSHVDGPASHVEGVDITGLKGKRTRSSRFLIAMSYALYSAHLE